MNGPIKDRAVRRKQHILDGLNIAERPESCKLLGRLNENFEDISQQSENSTNTFGMSMMKFFCHNKPENGNWSSEQFEKVIKICGDNAIPVRESVKKIDSEEGGSDEIYFILMHFRAPLTFFGRGHDLESKKVYARNRAMQYLQTSFDHIQKEIDRVKENQRKTQEARKNKSRRGSVRF